MKDKTNKYQKTAEIHFEMKENTTFSNLEDKLITAQKRRWQDF